MICEKLYLKRCKKLKQKLKKFGAKLKQFFEGIDLKQIGKDIIAGLISGITAKATELYRKATEIASNISKKIKKALDSKSPSRETMKIGEDVGEGLAIGLDNKKARVKIPNRVSGWNSIFSWFICWKSWKYGKPISRTSNKNF